MYDTDDVDQDDITVGVDRIQLERLELPSGQGWVDFGDPYDLTGDQVQKLRKEAEKAHGTGDASNTVLTRCVALFVTSWEIKYLSDDAKLPRYDPKVLGKLKGVDLVAIERHIRPAMALYMDVPGSSVDNGSP
ncbi:MAG TPA: hypothetical protein DGT23_22465 [Micromonosporaceae bacterium]|nr:hypothetical protein [Micromonosporaceae bacterium]